MEPRPEVLALPDGASPAKVRAFVASTLRGHELGPSAARLAAALAADTALHFNGRPCQVDLYFTPAALRITVTAILPEVPSPRPPDAEEPRPIDVVLREGVLYGSAVSMRDGTSAVWVELPWDALPWDTL